MLYFPENYFKKEMQSGYVVSEIMKRVWAASLEVLQEVIALCDRNNLHYVIYWGTLLGAVRHKGFIPWDDDIDIVLLGEDYVKFLELARNELPDEYFVLNVYEADGYRECFTRVTNGNVVSTCEPRMKGYHNCPFAVGVDIFPLYYLPRDEQCAEEQRILLSIIEELYKMLEYRERLEREGSEAEEIRKFSEALAKRILALQEITGLKLEKGKNIKTQLGIMYDQICRLYSAEDGDYVTLFPMYLKDGFCVPKEEISDYIMLPFENMMLKAPKEYDVALNRLYGDYMTPVKGAGDHEYIFFKGQMEDLLDVLCLEKIDLSLFVEPIEMERILSEGETKKLYYISENGERNRKKVVLYAPTWTELICNGGYSMDKLRNVLKAFKERKDVLFWWFSYPLKEIGKTLIKNMTPELYADYIQITEEYKQVGWGIWDVSGQAGKVANLADVFYGDKGQFCDCCEQLGKKIFVQEYEEPERIECTI